MIVQEIIYILNNNDRKCHPATRCQYICPFLPILTTSTPAHTLLIVLNERTFSLWEHEPD